MADSAIIEGVRETLVLRSRAGLLDGRRGGRDGVPRRPGGLRVLAMAGAVVTVLFARGPTSGHTASVVENRPLPSHRELMLRGCATRP